MDIEKAKRARPKKVRPALDQPVADRFWDYCRKHDLTMYVLLSEIVEDWLDKQEKKELKAC